jgi:acetylornithine deacetylase
MGFVFFKVEFEGKANHSGEKWAGVSAIDKALKVIRGLNELEHEWLLTYKHPLLPAPNLNIGVIHGGTAGSTVAGNCYFETCIHYLPKQMSYDKVYTAFTNVVNDIAKSDPWMREHMPKITMYQSGGAFEQDAKAVSVEALKTAYREALDVEANIVGSPAGCDSRLWKNIAGSEVLLIGPGNLSECHAVNEYVELNAFYNAILVYAHFILNWAEKFK